MYVLCNRCVSVVLQVCKRCVCVTVSQYEDVADKDDLMGVEDTAKKDILH